MLKYLLPLLILTSCAKYEAPPTAPALSTCTPVLNMNNIQYVNVSDAPIQLFDSKPGNEIVQCLNTFWPLRNNRYEFYPLYSFYISGIKAGGLVELDAELEVTNDSKVNMQIGTYYSVGPNLVMSGGPTAANGYNVTPGMHHGKVFQMAKYIASADFSGYITLVGYSGTDGLPQAFLTVHKNSGRMYIKITKASMLK